MSGIKHDKGKLDLTLVPIETLQALTRAKQFGALKYGRNNYKGGISYVRVSAAALRHLFAWLQVEDKDSESGLNHLDHLLACISMLVYYDANPRLKQLYDDRDLIKTRTIKRVVRRHRKRGARHRRSRR